MNKRTKQIVILAIGVSPYVLGISTAMGVKGTTTAPAVFFDMQERAADWQSYVEQEQSSRAEAQSVVDTLSPLQSSICTNAESEGQSGGITGSPGPGAVSAALESSCAGLNSIVEALYDAAKRDAERSEALTARVEHLRNLPERVDISVFERQRQFREQVGKIKADLASSSAENLREKVNAQLAILSQSVIQLETKGGSFGARQASAVASLKQQLGEVEKIFNEFLKQDVASEELAEPADLLFSGAAIMRWWPRLLPQILLALAVDLIILWMAAFLGTTRASLRETEAALRRKAQRRAAQANQRKNSKKKKGV